MPNRQRSFKSVIEKVGAKPTNSASQNTLRRYSETFSKETAHWLRELCHARGLAHRMMMPEEPVATIYGKKSLDVGGLDARGYLVLDFSIKTFNFRDRCTGNYRHNYTGRFYELLGEELDLRRSYRFATLVAIVFLPSDSADDGAPSSFASAVKQFSKIARLPGESAQSAAFDHVFVALHHKDGGVVLFDASRAPPISGLPPQEECLTIDQVLDAVAATVRSRTADLRLAPCPRVREYLFGPDRRPGLAS
jgi:hypothetical protein